MSVTNAQDLRNTGLKVTQPRLKILEIFQRSAQRHMTAEDVYRELINQQAGILSRTHFEAGKALFEINEGKHHDHLLCVDCGRVEEFVDAEIERRQHKIAADRGFVLREHSLALYASCARTDCPHRPDR